MGTKFHMKISWNQMPMDEIKNKIQIRKWLKKQKAIKRMKTKFDIKIKWNQMMRDEIEEKS
jgi:hypothetical protein